MRGESQTFHEQDRGDSASGVAPAAEAGVEPREGEARGIDFDTEYTLVLQVTEQRLEQAIQHMVRGGGVLSDELDRAIDHTVAGAVGRFDQLFDMCVRQGVSVPDKQKKQVEFNRAIREVLKRVLQMYSRQHDS